MFIGGVARESSTAFLFMSINNLKIYNVMDDAADIQRNEIELKEQEDHCNAIKSLVNPYVHKPPFNFQHVVDVNLVTVHKYPGVYMFRKVINTVTEITEIIQLRNVIIIEHPNKYVEIKCAGNKTFAVPLDEIVEISIEAKYSNVDNDPSLNRIYSYKRKNH